ncbi:MAG: undecaprenyl-diphosphate phosphatase, partial [Planctomycetota bacterium]
EFSFFIAIPAILGATVLKLREALAISAENADPIVWGPALVGAAVSLVVGVLSLRLLLGAVRRAKLHYFALYCWVVGAMLVGKVLYQQNTSGALPISDFQLPIANCRMSI